MYIASDLARHRRSALIEQCNGTVDEGVNHVALNPTPMRRPFADVANGVRGLMQQGKVPYVSACSRLGSPRWVRRSIAD